MSSESEFELWMRHRNFPEHIKRKIRTSELCQWKATRGIDGLMLINSLSPELQRDVRRHIFRYFKQVSCFDSVDEQTLDAICESIKEITYIERSTILEKNKVVTNLIINRKGMMEKEEEDGTKITLYERSVCGQELLALYQQDVADAENSRQGRQLRSSNTVRCLTNVEAYVISAEDLNEAFKSGRL